MTNEEKEVLYQQALRQMNNARDEGEFSLAAQRFGSLYGYKDSVRMQQRCNESAADCMNKKTYVKAISVLNYKSPSLQELQNARSKLMSLNGWGDSKHQIELIDKKINKLAKKNRKGRSKGLDWRIIVGALALVAVLCVGGYFLFFHNSGDSTDVKTTEASRVKKAKIPFNPDKIIDSNSYNYSEITDMLVEAGFTNVDVEAVHDLITGFLQHPGTVESISIEGDRDFKKGDEFDADVHIIVKYHSK